jgi:hypothetical protein
MNGVHQPPAADGQAEALVPQLRDAAEGNQGATK